MAHRTDKAKIYENGQFRQPLFIQNFCESAAGQKLQLIDVASMPLADCSAVEKLISLIVRIITAGHSMEAIFGEVLIAADLGVQARVYLHVQCECLS